MTPQRFWQHALALTPHASTSTMPDDSNATDKDRPNDIDRLCSRLGLAVWFKGEPARLRLDDGRIRADMQGAEPGACATYMRPRALIEAMASDDVRPMAEKPFAAWIAERAGAEASA